MRIFERLRGRGRSNSNVKRKFFEVLADSFLESLEEKTTAPVLVASNRNCCSAEGRTIDQQQG